MADHDDDKSSRQGMAVLSKANYVTWMAQVEDHIGAIDHEDAMTIWDDFMWKKDPDDDDDEDPIDRDWQLANSAPTKKRRLMHNKLWSHLRKHLDTEMFQSSLRVKTKSVPLLLRHIRDKWHKHSPADRAKLKDKLNAMKVSDYANMELYGESFMTLIEIMRNYDIGMANSEEDCIYAFEQGIPVEWDTYKAIRRANFDNLKGTIDHYVAVSKSNPNLIGSVGNDKQPDKVFATTTTTSTELCRNFAKESVSEPTADTNTLDNLDKTNPKQIRVASKETATTVGSLATARTAVPTLRSNSSRHGKPHNNNNNNSLHQADHQWSTQPSPTLSLVKPKTTLLPSTMLCG